MLAASVLLEDRHDTHNHPKDAMNHR